jgi:D-sedoheptulose 7-phosphate isomerase
MDEAGLRHAVEDSLALKRRFFDESAPLLLDAGGRIAKALLAGGKLLVFGNGGSAADAQHFAAELAGRFQRERAALSALALTTDPSVITALANDYGFEHVFRRQVEAHGRAGDVAVGYTTSGRSENVVRGLRTARAAGLSTVLFAGDDGGPAAGDADVALVVPSTVTARVQEMHVLLMHLVVEQVDAWAAGAGLTEPAGSGGSAGAGAGSSQ